MINFDFCDAEQILQHQADPASLYYITTLIQPLHTLMFGKWLCFKRRHKMKTFSIIVDFYSSIQINSYKYWSTQTSDGNSKDRTWKTRCSSLNGTSICTICPSRTSILTNVVCWWFVRHLSVLLFHCSSSCGVLAWLQICSTQSGLIIPSLIGWGKVPEYVSKCSLLENWWNHRDLNKIITIWQLDSKIKTRITDEKCWIIIF